MKQGRTLAKKAWRITQITLATLKCFGGIPVTTFSGEDSILSAYLGHIIIQDAVLPLLLSFFLLGT